MRCINCNRELPENAKVCGHCEAPVMPAPGEGEMQFVAEFLKQMPPDVAADFRQTLESSETADELINRIFVGNCPKCDSENTGDCEHDPDIVNLLVGRCYDCGQLWCTECEKLLDRTAPECPCWDEELPDPTSPN
ncbi:MAG: zinc ribbon domain-containing protein [Planctomycetes bacterium]|nr:zinc ribbon domain-containing protein [Planctomycetota bacterium]